MNIKWRKQNKTNSELELVANLALVSRLKDTLAYIEPELTDDEVITKLVVILSGLISVDTLDKTLSNYSEQAENKLSEVKNLYAIYFSDEPNE